MNNIHLLLYQIKSNKQPQTLSFLKKPELSSKPRRHKNINSPFWKRSSLLLYLKQIKKATPKSCFFYFVYIKYNSDFKWSFYEL